MSYVYKPTVLTRNCTGQESGYRSFNVTSDKITIYQDGKATELLNVNSQMLEDIETECERNRYAGTQETPHLLLAYAYKHNCFEFWEKYKNTPLALKAMEEVVKSI